MKFLLLSILTFSSFALVDYTDDTSSSSAQSVKKTRKRTNKNRSAPRSTEGSASNIDLKATFTNYSYQTVERSGSVDSVAIDGHLQTSYDFYLDFNYPMFTGRIDQDQINTSYQSGNAKVLLGMNWLRFGSTSDALALDVYAGASFAGKSEFASQRTDQIVGVQSSKRISSVALSMGYELMLTGSSKDALEQDIGNISQLKTQIGILISDDITFIINARTISISESNDSGRSNALSKKLKYSFVAPELVLTISRGVDVQFSGLFLTRRPKSAFVSRNSKLWSLPGFYGNSLSGAINIAI